MTLHIRINPDLDPEALGRAYRTKRRLQIPDFLTEDSAEALFEAIQANQSWFLAYNEDGEAVESPLADIQRLTAAQRNEFLQRINQRAASQFQYCFLQYYVSEAVKRGDEPGHALHGVHEFLNGPACLAFVRTLTGEPAIRYADALASLYAPGHFLTEHDDTHGSRDRVAAYVVSLTRNWNRNWGGHLAFFDERGNIEEAFMPTFNTLNIFGVPQLHSVQPVAGFARGVRTSVTGWFHR